MQKSPIKSFEIGINGVKNLLNAKNNTPFIPILNELKVIFSF